MTDCSSEQRVKSAIPGGCFLPALLLLMSGSLQAAENSASDPQPIPNLELLEFLGSFATEAGEWIDPDSLLEDEFSALLDAYSNRAVNAEQTTDDSDNQDSAND